MPAQLDLAAEKLVAWKHDPVLFVREVWGVEPDAWQANVLREYGKPGRKYISMQACAGPGKSCVMAWIGLNFLLCHGAPGQHPNGFCISISKDNLTSGLWKELAKWGQQNDVFRQCFDFKADSIVSKEFPRTWFLAARTWPRSANAEEQGLTLSGLHGQYMLYLIDEGGGIPVTVLKAARQGMTTEGGEGAIVVAGNPITRTGILYQASVTERADWFVQEITGDPDDPERSPRINLEDAQRSIDLYGRDDPWVMAYVLGKFPLSAIDSLLSEEEVRLSMRRSYRREDFEHAPKVLGVDVARLGLDRTVIYPRQGLVAFEPIELGGMDSVDIAGHVARKWQEWEADACFIDDTGGWGAGVIDQLRRLKFKPTGIPFSGKADDPRYFNKRTEMAFLTAEWVRDAGQLPNDLKLLGDLTVPTYGFKGDRMALEEKDRVRERLGRSPDHGDALGLTFAHPVAQQPLARDIDIFLKPKQAKTRRDPFYDI